MSEFDIPISLLSINPLGVHYFELFGLSIGMYVKLKEELRTIEFIKKYFSNIYINKPEMVHSYESNHFMLNLRPIIKSKGPIEEVIRLED